MAVALLELLQPAVLIVDSDGETVMVTDELMALFSSGLSPSEVMGWPLSSWASKPPFGVAAALWTDTGSGVVHELALPSGKTVEGRWHFVALPAGPGRVAVFRDVSAEAALRAQVRVQNKGLAELAATKTELVSVLLHELRTPLTSLTAAIQCLPAVSSDPDVSGILPMLDRGVARLTAVMDEMSAVPGLESGALAVSSDPVDLAPIVEETVARWSAYSDTQVTVDAVMSAGPAVYGDAHWLATLVDRLVAVAVAAAEPEATVTFSVQPGAEGWLLVLPLQDGAAGDRLFTSTAGKSNATALALVRAIVGRHGGQLAVRSSDEGAALHALLPYRPEPVLG